MPAKSQAANHRSVRFASNTSAHHVTGFGRSRSAGGRSPRLWPLLTASGRYPLAAFGQLFSDPWTSVRNFDQAILLESEFIVRTRRLHCRNFEVPKIPQSGSSRCVRENCVEMHAVECVVLNYWMCIGVRSRTYRVSYFNAYFAP